MESATILTPPSTGLSGILLSVSAFNTVLNTPFVDVMRLDELTLVLLKHWTCRK